MALNFNARNYAPAVEFEPIPDDWYAVKIIQVQRKNAKTHEKSKYLNIQFQIIHGDYEGRKVYLNVTTDNMNTTAVDVGNRQLSAICYAAHRLSIKEESDLLNARLRIKTISSVNDRGGINILIKNFADLQGNTAKELAESQGIIEDEGDNTPLSSLQLAKQDGWTEHPQDNSYWYRGSEVIEVNKLELKYPIEDIPALPEKAPPIPKKKKKKKRPSLVEDLPDPLPKKKVIRDIDDNIIYGDEDDEDDIPYKSIKPKRKSLSTPKKKKKKTYSF